MYYYYIVTVRYIVHTERFQNKLNKPSKLTWKCETLSQKRIQQNITKTHALSEWLEQQQYEI